MWHELIKDEVWECNNYLPETDLNNLKKLFADTIAHELAPGEWIRECFRLSKVNPTLYNYRVHPTATLESFASLIDSIFSPIEKLVHKPCPRSNFNQLQLFLKSFSHDSFYDLHCEPQWRYGEFAFLLFLDSCEKGGELIFPNEEMKNDYLEKHPNQKAHYAENIEILKRENETVRLIGPLSVRPSLNKALLFRTGSAHWVNPLDKSETGSRPTLASWPFATDGLIEALDTHCQIKNHFSAE